MIILNQYFSANYKNNLEDMENIQFPCKIN